MEADEFELAQVTGWRWKYGLQWLAVIVKLWRWPWQQTISQRLQGIRGELVAWSNVYE